MKVSVDGGALSQDKNHRFGTAVYSENLVRALKLFDKKNHYYFYTFKSLKPKLFWLKGRISLEEFKEKKDVFLALNQAIPLYVSGKIISISHGLSYQQYPRLYSKEHITRLKAQLGEMVERSDKIVVSSARVKDEFISLFPNSKSKLIVLPFGLPFDMSTKKNLKRDKYYLFVGNTQKIKNVDFVIETFKNSLLYKNGFKLVLVGNWKDYENKKIGITSAGNISRKRLKTLYQKAAALLTSSYYESFNFPVLEALSQGCPVIGLESAVIPELKPYVNLANDQGAFIKKMKTILVKPDEKSIKQLHKKFNWKDYVKNLVRLYKR